MSFRKFLVQLFSSDEPADDPFVLCHDDPPCEEPLVDGYCVRCGFVPDMQSTSFRRRSTLRRVEGESTSF